MPLNRREKARALLIAADLDGLPRGMTAAEEYAALCEQLVRPRIAPPHPVGTRVRVTDEATKRAALPEALRDGYVIERSNNGIGSGCLVQHNGARLGWMDYELDNVAD